MELIKKYKNILLSVVIIAVAAVLYTMFFGKDGVGTSLLTSSRPSEAAATIVGEDLLVLLRTLRSINLNEELFDDPAFRSLEDFGQELVPEPIGRNNPFAPIGQEEDTTNNLEPLTNN